jgi:hypothetical protein
MKGRIRILDSNLKDLKRIDLVKESLEKLDGIKDIRITDTVGSLLINYDPIVIPLEGILGSLEGLVNLEMESVDKKESNILNKKAMGNFLGNMIQETGRGQGRGGGNERNISNTNFLSIFLDQVSDNQLVKTALLGFVGVKGYKKGKGMYKNR